MKADCNTEGDREILLRHFRAERPFSAALAEIKEIMEPTIHEERALEALWDIWEMFGGPDDG